MEELIKKALNTSLFEKTQLSSGCITNGTCYKTDNEIVLVNQYILSTARKSFESESEQLKVLGMTDYFKVPEPLCVVDLPDRGAAFAKKYFEFKPLSRNFYKMGENLAKLHLHNIKLEEKSSQADQFAGRLEDLSANTYVPKFGFPITTYCGGLPQNNTWCDNWVEFIKRKLTEDIAKLEEESGNSEILDLWSKLEGELGDFFKELGPIKPSLLHGQLWDETCGETEDNQMVLFDPACFYGHHEYDLAMEEIAGSNLFRKPFWDGYRSLIEEAEGFRSRQKLYLLCHLVNNWLNYGIEYEDTVKETLRTLVNDPIH